jgi:hypothetical protein
MRRIRFFLAAILVMAVAATSITPSRVKAIVDGFVDTNNAFRNTEAFIIKSPTTGNIFPICSGR